MLEKVAHRQKLDALSLLIIEHTRDQALIYYMYSSWQLPVLRRSNGYMAILKVARRK